MGQLITIPAACLSIPKEDAAEFAGLYDEVKMEVKAWLRELAVVSRAANKHQAFMRAADALNVSWQTVRTKFYALKNGGDWRCLINRAKQREDGDGVPDAIVEEFARRARASIMDCFGAKPAVPPPELTPVRGEVLRA